MCIKLKLLILVYIILPFVGNAQETKGNGVFYRDFNIFNLEGEGVIESKKAVKKDKYVKIVADSVSTKVSVFDSRYKKAKELEFDSSRLLLMGRNFLMHRIPRSGTASNEKIRIIGRDSLLIFQTVKVVQGVFPSIIYKSKDTIKIEVWMGVRDYDSFSLEYLVSNSDRIVCEKFFKEGENWVNEYMGLKTGYSSRRKLKSKHLRYIDIMAWCYSRYCRIK